MRQIFAVLVSATFFNVACDAGDADRLRPEQAQSEAATIGNTAPGDDLVVSIPLVGHLTWTCNDAHEFAFTFAPDQATVVVEQSIGGEITRRQLHPGDVLASGFAPADIHREWTVMYRHKPATISAAISVVPAVRRGQCFIRNSTLEQNRNPS